MKLKELRAIVTAQPADLDELEVKIWLPGSLISLAKIPPGGEPRPAYMIPNTRKSATQGIDRILMLEGNVDPGSALAEEFRPTPGGFRESVRPGD